MVRTAKKLIAVLLTAVLLLSFSVSANADELRAGTVAGLPEKLVVLDDNGNSVSENGEYFISFSMRSQWRNTATLTWKGNVC